LNATLVAYLSEIFEKVKRDARLMDKTGQRLKGDINERATP
jgi:hypothetical protein